MYNIAIILVIAVYESSTGSARELQWKHYSCCLFCWDITVCAEGDALDNPQRTPGISLSPPPLSHSLTSFFSLRKVVQKCPSQMPVKCVEGMLCKPVISTASSLSLVMLVTAKHTTSGNSCHRAVALSLLLSMRHSLLCQPLRSWGVFHLLKTVLSSSTLLFFLTRCACSANIHVHAFLAIKLLIHPLFSVHVFVSWSL